MIRCTVENSCFPKNELDRSGSGIGLENLRRRLSLLYPGQHILRMEKIGEQYVAQLILTLKPHVQDQRNRVKMIILSKQIVRSDVVIAFHSGR